MSRCNVCDYSDEQPSILADSLTDGIEARSFRTVRGETICSVCRGSIGEAVKEMIYDDHPTHDNLSFVEDDVPEELDHIELIEEGS